jgi:hypothetical protein
MRGLEAGVNDITNAHRIVLDVAERLRRAREVLEGRKVHHRRCGEI